jgi:Fur family transcriptional regulator, ferric uptake regulator
MTHLSQAGYRITMPRRAVAEALSAVDTPLSADEILVRGQRCHKRLGLVTVYRTLDLFEGLGLVCRVHLREGCHGYLATTPGHRHVLLCQVCGRSVEFSGRGDLDTLIVDLERQTGYRVRDHLLQLFGLCPGCCRTEPK